MPLVTIDHISDRSNGEKFDRTVVHTAQQFPLFLIKGDGSNAIASAKFQVKSADSVSSSIAATALQLAQNAARAAAPQSAVVTTLTEQQTRNVANSIDNAVNQLFSSSLNEGQWLDNDIRRWDSGVVLTFSIPKSEGRLKKDKDAYQIVGRWYVSFENPRPSIFSDRLICKPASDGTTSGGACIVGYATAATQAERDTVGGAAAVLQFPLIKDAQSLGTVSAYLQQQPWWSPAITAFAKGGDALNAASIATFCQNIKLAITAINLNRVDAGIVANAVREGLPLPDRVSGLMASAEQCSYRYPLH